MRGSPTASRRPLEPPPTGTGPPRTGYGPVRSKYVPLWSRLDVPPVTAASEQPQKACPYGCRRRHGAGNVNCMRARSIRIARLKGRIAGNPNSMSYAALPTIQLFKCPSAPVKLDLLERLDGRWSQGGRWPRRADGSSTVLSLVRASIRTNAKPSGRSRRCSGARDTMFHGGR